MLRGDGIRRQGGRSESRKTVAGDAEVLEGGVVIGCGEEVVGEDSVGDAGQQTSGIGVGRSGGGVNDLVEAGDDRFKLAELGTLHLVVEGRRAPGGNTRLRGPAQIVGDADEHSAKLADSACGGLETNVRIGATFRLDVRHGTTPMVRATGLS